MDQIIRYDTSGVLLAGLFFEFGIAETLPFDWSKGALTVLSERCPSDGELTLKGEEHYMIVESEGSGEEEIHHGCLSDQTHVTARYWTKQKVYLRGGMRLSPFLVNLSEMRDEMIVSGKFADQLRRSGLKGFDLLETEIEPLHPSMSTPHAAPKDLAIFVCNFMGRPCERPMRVRGAPNACPFCAKAPLICQGCGKGFDKCPACGKVTLATRERHGGLNDGRLIIEPIRNSQSRILEGNAWDGSDFIFRLQGGGFITRRCLDWLLSVHAAPFYAVPALVNVEGLSREQLAKIEAAKTPVKTRAAE